MKSIFFKIGLALVILLIVTYFIKTMEYRTLLPAFVRISQPFGKRKDGTFHNGIDLSAVLGSPIYAANDGRVNAFKDSQGGNQITIQGAQFRSGYAHLKDFAVKSGDMVKKGTLIGWVGMTGKTSGPHLHLTKYVNGNYVEPVFNS